MTRKKNFKKSFSIIISLLLMVGATNFSPSIYAGFFEPETTAAIAELVIQSTGEELLKYKTVLEILKNNKNLPEISNENPLCEIDALIFSSISYLPMMKIIPKLGLNSEHISLRDYTQVLVPFLKEKDPGKIKLKISEDEKHVLENYQNNSDSNRYKDTIKLLEYAGENTRYQNILIGDRRLKFDSKSQAIQFAAITFTAENAEKIVTFRGTDSSFVGWNENLNMLWQEEVPAQKEAQSYLALICNKYPESKIIITGHSKGGNLAVYSALKLAHSDFEKFRKAIKNIYNLDGPGLKCDIVENHKDAYEKFRDKVHTFVPSYSTVGMLLSNSQNINYNCIYSNSLGILNQHSALSWEINPDFAKLGEEKFRISKIDVTSEFIEETIGEITHKLDKETLKVITATLFDFYKKNNISLEESVSSNLKRVIHNYLIGKSTWEILKLIWSPSKIITLSTDEKDCFNNAVEVTINEFFKAYLKRKGEIDRKMNFSEESKKDIDKITKIASGVGKRARLTYYVARLLIVEYFKKSSIVKFLRKIF